MRVVVCGALLVLLMTTALSAQEEEFSANNLLEGCKRFLNTELSGSPLELLKDGQCIASMVRLSISPRCCHPQLAPAFQ
jgi:hypothetical protein